MSSKISELTALGETPADDDIFPIVDTSASQTKSVTYANLRGPTSAGTKVLIEEITLSTAGEFDFDNIPQDYDRLIIEGTLRGNVSANNDLLVAYLNTDTTDANYYRQNDFTKNGVADISEGTAPYIGHAPGSTSPSGTVTSLSLKVEDYAGSNVKNIHSKTVSGLTATENVSGDIGIVSSVTDAITRIRIRTDNHPTDGLTGTLRLYGEKSLTLEDSETITVKKAVPVTLSGGDFTIDLTDYQDGDRLVLCGAIASTGGSGVDTVGVYFNGDTTATNYQSQRFASVNTGASVTEANNAELWIVADSTTPSNAVSSVCAVINDYAVAGSIKTARGEYNAPTSSWASMWTGTNDVMHRTSTAAITSITLSGASTLTGTLQAYIEKEGVLPVSQGPHVIESITLSTAGEFDFDNIPQGYRRLHIKGTLASDVAGVSGDGTLLYFNTDTTDTNYHTQIHRVINGTVNSSEYDKAFPAVVPAAGAPSNSVAQVDITIEGYAGSSAKTAISDFLATVDANTQTSGKSFVQWDTADAITRVRVRTDNHPTDGLTGTLTLYGEY